VDLLEALVVADRFPSCIPEALAALEVLNPELAAGLRMARTPHRVYRLLRKADDSDSMQLNLAVALLDLYGLPSIFEPAPSLQERFPIGFLEGIHAPWP
jgi:vesicle coat complex subunit